MATADQLAYQQTGHERAAKINLICNVFIVTIGILNVLSSKMAQIEWNGEVVDLARIIGLPYTFQIPLVFSVGTLLYAVTFPCTDIISELVGQKRATKLIIHGFVLNIMVLLIIQAAILLPPASFYQDQDSYVTVLGSVWRLVFAGMTSYIIAQRFDVWFFDFAIRRNEKRIQGKSNIGHEVSKNFWKRALVTTVTSQAIDSIIFVSIGFLGATNSDGSYMFEPSWDGFKYQGGPLMLTTWLVKAVLTVPLLGIIMMLRSWIGYSNNMNLPDEHYAALHADE